MLVLALYIRSDCLVFSRCLLLVQVVLHRFLFHLRTIRDPFLAFFFKMPSDQRTSEEHLRKKAKVHKSSSKDSLDKTNDGGSRGTDTTSSAPPSKVPSSSSKDSASRSSSDKAGISYFRPKVPNLMAILSGSSNQSHGSAKASLVSKEAPSKDSTSPTKDVSSLADAGKSMALEKAKIQDTDAGAIANGSGSSGSKTKIQDKDTESSALVSLVPDPKAKIQEKTHAEAGEALGEAQIQDKGLGEGANSNRLSLSERFEIRRMLANLGILSDRSAFQLLSEPHIQPRGILAPSAGGELVLHSVFEAMIEEFLPFDVTFDSVETAEGSSLASDDVPANTFVMSAQAAKPFIAVADRIRLPRVEEELMSEGGDALYKSLLSSQVKVRSDRDALRKDLAALELKVKERENALALSEKRFSDLSLEKEKLLQAAKGFDEKVTSLDLQVEGLNTSLAKAVKENEDLIIKVGAAEREVASLAEAEKLRLADICSQIRAALVSVGVTPDSLSEDASTEHFQGWLVVNIPSVIEACRAFSKSAVQLAVRDVLFLLEAGASDAVAKASNDSFSFVSADSTSPALLAALVKFTGIVDESFWERILSMLQPPQDEDSFDFSLSEFATPKASSDVVSAKCVALESSSEVSLSEFATPEPSSSHLIRHEPPIEIFSSNSDINLSSDSEPLSPVEGGEGPFTFPPGSLVANGRVYRPEIDVPEGSRGCVKRRSRGRRPRGGGSSNRGTAKKKKGGNLRHRNSSTNAKSSSSSFDAASHVERMIDSGVIDPVFQRPYSPSSGYDIDEFGIICQMLLELGLIVKQEPDDGSP
ncbi:hypothetical protein EJB05_44513, partial [Eragrostis curvula]